MCISAFRPTCELEVDAAAAADVETVAAFGIEVCVGCVKGLADADAAEELETTDAAGPAVIGAGGFEKNRAK